MLNFLNHRAINVKTEASDHYYWRLRILSDIGEQSLSSFDKLVADKNSYFYLTITTNDIAAVPIKSLRTDIAKRVYDATMLGMKLKQLYDLKNKHDHSFSMIRDEDMLPFENWGKASASEKLEIVYAVYMQYHKVLCTLTNISVDIYGMYDILHLSTELQYHHLVIDLVAVGKNVDFKNQYGQTALMKACWAGQVETVKILLQLGADPEAKDFSNKFVIQFQPLNTSENIKAMVASIIKTAIHNKELARNSVNEISLVHNLASAVEGLSINEQGSRRGGVKNLKNK